MNRPTLTVATLVVAVLLASLALHPGPGPGSDSGPGSGPGSGSGSGSGSAVPTGVRRPANGSSPEADAEPVVRAGARTPWVWPTGVRVVERPWQAPDGDYGAGHRGIDVPAALGTPARAVDDGVVTFAGSVAGRGVVTIDHGDGLRSTLDSLAPSVATGDRVTQDAVVGTVAVGHCPASAPCLHLGARLDDRYVDPTRYLPAAAWPVLLPASAWPG